MKRVKWFFKYNYVAIICTTFMIIHGVYGYNKLHSWDVEEKAYTESTAIWMAEHGYYESKEAYLQRWDRPNYSAVWFATINIGGALGILGFSMYKMSEFLNDDD